MSSGNGSGGANVDSRVMPVKVALRIRPLVAREKGDGCSECMRTVPGEPQVQLGKDKAFTYDFVFTQQTPQVEVYETSVQPLITALFKGYNATVLAYGQTGSGKTYTMGSGYQTLSAANATLNQQDSAAAAAAAANFDEVGVIPRVLNDLFRTIEGEPLRDNGTRFNVKVSFVEVYNEVLKDLFNTKTLGAGAGTGESLRIRKENKTMKVVCLKEIDVRNAVEAIQKFERGSSMRVVGGTAMNEKSSRSHAIFTIILEQVRADIVKVSKFHLVDLAGSECQKKTKTEGIRMHEAKYINKSLHALSNVISELGKDNPTNMPRHVRYRDSKLTLLLQDSLGGNSQTLMIACVSPAQSNMKETLSTLRFAYCGRKIKNKPVVNVDPQAAELSVLRPQIQEMRGLEVELNTLRNENKRQKLENCKMLQRMFVIKRLNNARLSKVKQERVKLIKQMKTDTETFRKYRQDKEKEVGPRKALKRKRPVEINRLQEGNNRQQNILRCKNEEITRIQRQLRETLEKQKQEAEKRQQTFERKDSSSLGEELSQCITQKLELSASLTKARIILNMLLEERKEAAAELARLKQCLAEACDSSEGEQPIVKRHRPNDTTKPAPEMDVTCNAACVGGDDNDMQQQQHTDVALDEISRAQLEQRIERLAEDIECKSIQINTTQQMVIEGDQVLKDHLGHVQQQHSPNQQQLQQEQTQHLIQHLIQHQQLQHQIQLQQQQLNFLQSSSNPAVTGNVTSSAAVATANTSFMNSFAAAIAASATSTAFGSMSSLSIANLFLTLAAAAAGVQQSS